MWAYTYSTGVYAGAVVGVSDMPQLAVASLGGGRSDGPVCLSLLIAISNSNSRAAGVFWFLPALTKSVVIAKYYISMIMIINHNYNYLLIFFVRCWGPRF